MFRCYPRCNQRQLPASDPAGDSIDHGRPFNCEECYHRSVRGGNLCVSLCFVTGLRIFLPSFDQHT